MTTEEYIKNIDFEPFHYSDRVCANLNIQNFAKKAVNMARQEEREKAVRTLDITLTAIIARGENKVSFSNIRDQFDKLLNQ